MASDLKDINLPVLATIGVISVILVVVSVVGVQAWFRYAFQQEYEAKVFSQPYTELEQQKQQQEANLIVYRWVDQKNQIAAIPIDKAIEKVAERYSNPAAVAGHE